MKSLLIAYFVVILSVPVMAQEAVPLMKGSPAPMSGVLVTEGRLKRFLEAENKALDLEGRLEIQKRYTNNIESLYVGRLNEVAKQEWYQTPEFNRWLGFGVGVLVTGLAVLGASQLSRR